MTLLEPHLDIEQLSAAVDGTRDPAVAAHILVCLACRQQIDTWRRSLAPLRALPVPPASDVDPVIAAMAAWSPAAPGEAPLQALPSDAVAGAGRRSGIDRPPLTAVAPTGPHRRQRNVRLRRLQPPSGVAAALIAVVLLAGAVIGLHAAGPGGSSGSKSSASGASSGSKSTAALAPRAAGGAAAASSAPTSGGFSSVVPTAAVPSRSPSSAGQAVQSARSFAGTAQLAAQLRRVAPVGSGTPVPADTPCWRQARLLAANVPAVTTAAPSYTESVTLVGAPGRVFVFAETHGRVAVVVRPGTCSLLATVSF